MRLWARNQPKHLLQKPEPLPMRSVNWFQDSWLGIPVVILGVRTYLGTSKAVKIQ